METRVLLSRNTICNIRDALGDETYSIAVFFKPFLGLKFWNDTLNSESQDMVLPCIEVKRIEENMFSCTWLLQHMAAIVSLVSVHCRGHSLSSASYYTAADLYSTVYKTGKHFAKKTLQLCKCFTVSPLRSAYLAMHQTTRTKGRKLQRAFKTRWLSSEAAVRMSEILAIWAALKQLSEDKNDAMCVVLLRLRKTKNFNMLLYFCKHWHLTWQNWAKFFRRDILTLRKLEVS